MVMLKIQVIVARNFNNLTPETSKIFINLIAFTKNKGNVSLLSHALQTRIKRSVINILDIIFQDNNNTKLN